MDRDRIDALDALVERLTRHPGESRERALLEGLEAIYVALAVGVRSYVDPALPQGLTQDEAVSELGPELMLHIDVRHNVHFPFTLAWRENGRPMWISYATKDRALDEAEALEPDLAPTINGEPVARVRAAVELAAQAVIAKAKGSRPS